MPLLFHVKQWEEKMKVQLCKEVNDELLEFAVIIVKYRNQWVLCKHKQRTTYEFAGGHREKGEPILETAKRELYEETGAIQFELHLIGAYFVEAESKKNYGALYLAEVIEFGILPDFEMEKILFFEELPNNWTYPLIQPYLFQFLKRALNA